MMMKIDEARRILKSIIPANSARLEGYLEHDGEVSWRPTHFTVTLDGEFTWDELEAIAVYARSEYDPTLD